MKENELQTIYANYNQDGVDIVDNQSYYLVRLTELWGEDCLSLDENHDSIEEDQP